MLFCRRVGSLSPGVGGGSRIPTPLLLRLVATASGRLLSVLPRQRGAPRCGGLRLVHRPQVDKLPDADALAKLHLADGLSTEMANGKVFVGFRTEAPTFKPTFKVERACDLSYVEKRVWILRCGRIGLCWKAFSGILSQPYYPCPLESIRRCASQEAGK